MTLTEVMDWCRTGGATRPRPRFDDATTAITGIDDGVKRWSTWAPSRVIRSTQWPPPVASRRCYMCGDHATHSGLAPCVCCRLDVGQQRTMRT